METDIVKKKDVQEFETLLEKSFKKNNLKEFLSIVIHPNICK